MIRRLGGLYIAALLATVALFAFNVLMAPSTTGVAAPVALEIAAADIAVAEVQAVEAGAAQTLNTQSSAGLLSTTTLWIAVYFATALAMIGTLFWTFRSSIAVSLANSAKLLISTRITTEPIHGHARG